MELERNEVPNNMPFVTVDYDEWKPETYRGIVIKHEGRETRINSGNFLQDYAYAVAEYAPFLSSGTVNNYITDAKLTLT